MNNNFTNIKSDVIQSGNKRERTPWNGIRK